MRKKIIVMMICAGMSIGLVVGTVGSGQVSGAGKAAATAQSPSSAGAVTCAISPCSLEDVLFDKEFSSSLNGLNGNHEYAKLKAELDDLKAELAEIEQGTQEYQDKLAEIYDIAGKISVLVGGLNSQIDVITDEISEHSQETDEAGFTLDCSHGMIKDHIAEDKF